MKKEMTKLTIEQIILWSKATAVMGASMRRRPIGTVWMDSRKIGQGDVFVALPGDKDDGHHYVKAALKAGAVAAIVAKKKLSQFTGQEKKKLIAVTDPLQALQKIAARYRACLDIPIVAVTGSSGKTTTRSFLTSVLSAGLAVGSSEGNWNNHIGVPLSILRLKPEQDIAVLEFGANHANEIDCLTRIAQPDIGIITNIGYAHIGFFGGLAGTAEAKLEIVHGIHPEKGLLLFNGDDNLLVKKCAEHGYKALYFGCSKRCGIRARNIVVAEQETSFSVKGFQYKLPMAGKHFVYAALPAIFLATQLHISPEKIAAALGKMKPEIMRGTLEKKAGITFIVDCYNANPSSMKVAIDLLSDVAPDKRKAAIVGDMLELGKYSLKCHRTLGGQLADAGVKTIIAIGSFAEKVAQGAIQKGMNIKSIHCFDTTESAVKVTKNFLNKGDVVLLKGSRGMKLERIFEAM
jgi:UDP-N-acetylmuramoyl-tripeptide--D-alanyl-D-alanine ligase